jgi:hypothetical protein
MVQAADDADLLPSKPVGVPTPSIAYNVYDVAQNATAAPDEPPGSSVRLTSTAVADATFQDARITWGDTRCYTVRTVETIAGLAIESDAAPPACKTFVDTFAPAAPKNLQAVPSEGAISLIWDGNTEKDLAGYLVLRSVSGGPLQPMNDSLLQDPHFHDNVKSGLSFMYVVKAVDKAGNVSGESNRAEETAR